MADPHLNLFYSYNRSPESELIEDNLTRAFIQVLRALSAEARGWFLDQLFKDQDNGLSECDFTRAEFALQDHMTKPAHEFEVKRIVTLSTRVPETEEIKPEEQPSGGSRPDAWIYDSNERERSYCLLIECKRGDNPIDPAQLKRHTQEWFHAPLKEIVQTPLKWNDVLEAIEAAKNPPSRLNGQELHIVGQLEQFLGFFGYRVFKGFGFAGLRRVPDFRLACARARSSEHGGLFHFAELGPPLDFRLRNAAASSATEKDRLYCFKALGAAPAFRLCTRKGDEHGC
ncbi:hypothetical protein FJY68_08695 [candidate division WOR-3 bacterium]|uniref:Restriction endonuclease n=1 Tax=candidate division WOR-3 bacterium TaxID=2052148 RepID=A0A937XGC7_UNCW3|nr:hypothetical protein [candidate division WOR-3 bacterium]